MNATSKEQSYSLLSQLQGRSAGRSLVEALLYVALMAVCLAGNTMVLFIVYKQRNSGKMAFLLIASLAVSDILFFMANSWQAATVLYLGYWPFGSFTCQLQGYMVAALACASLLTLTLLAVNRYFRVVRSLKYRTVFTAKRTKCYMGAAWVLAFAEPIPYLASGERYAFQPGKFSCFQPNEISVGLLVYVYILIPTTVLTVCYYKIFTTVRRHQKAIAHMTSGLQPIPATSPSASNVRRYKTTKPIPATSPSASNVRRYKTTKMLFVTVVCFLCCWTPIFIIDFVDLARGSSALRREVYAMYTFLGFLSSCINPIVYGMMNSMFREEYKKIFKLRCVRKI